MAKKKSDRIAPHGHLTTKIEPIFCYRCNIAVGPEHWRKQKSPEAKFGYAWRCGEQARAYDRNHYSRSPEYRAKANATSAQRYQEFKPRTRWLSCRRFDKGRGFDMDQLIDVDDAIILMEMPCYYCASIDGQMGLDRLDSEIGHTLENCVSCCSICNSILCDLPEEAKEIMKPSLYQLRISGALGDWIPPRFRKKGGRRTKPENMVDILDEEEAA